MKTPETTRESTVAFGEGLSDAESQRTLAYIAQLISLDQIQEDFSATAFGERMSSIVRFQERFQPEHYPDELWLKYLGPQANNLTHGSYIRLLGDQVLDFEPGVQSAGFASVERFMFGFTNLTHDWGESNPEVGDVPFGEPKLNRVAERHTRDELARESLYRLCETVGITAEAYPNLDDVINAVVEWSDFTAFTKPDFSELAQRGDINPREYYQHLYRATKYMGHFSAALRAARLAASEQHEPILKGAAETLSIQVTHNALPVLIEYAHIFKGVKEYLVGNRELIDAVLGNALKVYHPTTTNHNDEYQRPMRLRELNERWSVYKEIMANESEA